MERWGFVDAVSRHGDIVTSALERLDDLELLERLDSGKYLGVPHDRVEALWVMVSLSERAPRHDLGLVLCEPDLSCDGQRSGGMIPRDHADVHAGTHAGGHRQIGRAHV